MNKKGLSLYLSLIFLNFLSYCTYGLPVTYFPNVAKNRGINDFIIGIIFSMYPLFSFVCGFIFGKMLNIWGKDKIIQSSQIILSMATLFFGLSSLFSSNILFVLVAMLARACQGIGIGGYQTVAYSYIPDIWPKEIDERVVIMEISLSFGIGIGPLLGSFLYEFLGYLYVFIVPSVMILFFGLILSVWVLPHKPPQQNDSENKKEIDYKRQKTMGILKTFSIKDVAYLFLTLTMVLASFTFVMPEFENKVISLQETPQMASIIFAMQPGAYLIVCIWIFFRPIRNRKGIFFIALFINIIGICCFGIDNVFQVNNTSPVLIFMGIAFAINGIVTAFTLVPFISECLCIFQKELPEYEESAHSGMASGIFNGSIALAEFLGPIIGGILCDFFGFSKSCLMFSGVAFAFFVLFAAHGHGWRGFCDYFKGDQKDLEENCKNVEVEQMLLTK